MGAGIARLLAPGDLVVIRGELGSGKTTLVRGAARALGVAEPVTSPTYTLANRYQGRVPVAHLDAYRLSDPDDEEIGLALEVVGEDAVAFIEWPESLAAGFPKPRIEVDISHASRDRRLVALRAIDPTLRDALHRLADDIRSRHRNA